MPPILGEGTARRVVVGAAPAYPKAVLPFLKGTAIGDRPDRVSHRSLGGAWFPEKPRVKDGASRRRAAVGLRPILDAQLSPETSFHQAFDGVVNACPRYDYSGLEPTRSENAMNLTRSAAITFAFLALAGCQKDHPKQATDSRIAAALVGGQSKVLAECGPQAGHAYYANAGLVSSKDSGWVKDGVSAGGTSLVRRDDGQIDVRFADASEKVYSALDDGGTVSIHRISSDEITVLVAYPSNTIEIYQFLKTNQGSFQMLQLQSKGGTGPLYKAAVMVASCTMIDFSS